jgi:hypothetical protein
MADTLKSITNRIHWSLLLKPLALVAAWYWLPFWLFFFVACFLYLFPLLPRSEARVAFLILLVISYFLSHELLHAAWIGVLFFLIVGIRELIFVDRRRAYHILVLCLAALGLFSYATTLGFRGLPFALWELGIGAVGLYGLLSVSFGRTQAALMTFLMAELTLVASLLPLNAFYMTALTFMSFAFLVDSAERMRSKEWHPVHVFLGFSIFFLFTVFILISNPWRP